MVRSKAFLAVMAGGVVAMVMVGCAPSYNPEDIQAFAKPQDVRVTSTDYVLEPPDEIEIHSSKVPEIHLERQRIRPDGKVSYEGLGEFDVAGKTIGEATAMLTERVKALYKLPGEHPIDLRMTAYMSKVFYVLGQVDTPGPMTYTGRNTLLSALAYAHPNVMAETKDIRVIRPSYEPGGQPKMFVVNYQDMMERGDVTKNVLLEAGDIIYVRPTWLASVALVVEEFVRPIGRAFGTVYTVNRATAPGPGGL